MKSDESTPTDIQTLKKQLLEKTQELEAEQIAHAEVLSRRDEGARTLTNHLVKVQSDICEREDDLKAIHYKYQDQIAAQK